LIAERHLPLPRKLIIAGDLVNLDAFSGYEPVEDNLPDFSAEIEASDDFFDQIGKTFQEILWFYGNHEERGTRGSGGVISPLTIARTILGEKLNKVQVNSRGFCHMISGGREWLIAHGKNYSVQQLNVAEWLSWKYHCNVVSFHEHHLAMGYDRYKKYQVINGGGLFQADQLGYAVKQASKSANMQNGFVLFRRGYPHLFGPDGFTDWRLWIDDVPLERNGNGRKELKAAA
jgi:hypothetical protein